LQKEIARTFGVSRWTIRRWCQKLGIPHHTTGQFRKGTKGNVPHIHEEMPFGIGVLFGNEKDELYGFCRLVKTRNSSTSAPYQLSGRLKDACRSVYGKALGSSFSAWATGMSASPNS